ncbi:hypothetical protein EJ110_NYTH60404, partial [Nymphaea thermarum]
VKREAAYFVVVLHDWRSVVIAVRGTETPEDLLTDGLCRECILTDEDLDGLINNEHLMVDARRLVLSTYPHYGHSGIVESARELHMQLDGQSEENDAVFGAALLPLWLTSWTFQSFLVAGFVAVLHLSSTSSSLLRLYKVHIMDERTSSTPLPKLTSSNFVSWAKTMENFIRSKGLWGLVDGSKGEPQLVLTKTIDGKAHELDGVEKDKVMNEYEKKWEEWKIGHHKIITWIIACVDATTMGQIAKHNFAHEAWEFLKKTHTMKDVVYMCNLQMKIVSLQQGDKSIKEYVGEMEQLWDELALFEPEWRRDFFKFRSNGGIYIIK